MLKSLRGKPRRNRPVAAVGWPRLLFLSNENHSLGEGFKGRLSLTFGITIKG